MPHTEYQWRSGYNNPVPAPVAGAHIKRLGKGKLEAVTVSQVLADARSPRSPLHGAFTWDNTVAGEKWREAEARQLLACLVIVQHGPADPPKRVLVNVRNPSEPGRERRYVTWSAALTEPPIRQEILLRAVKDVLFWREKYREFTELAEIFAVIDRVAPALREDVESPML